MAKQQVTALDRSMWGLGIATGVLAILFGILALFWPGLTVGLLIILFGVFVLVWGIVGLIVSLSRMGRDTFWWLELVFSLLAIGLAVYLLRNPAIAAGVFVFFIGFTFIIRGVVDLLEGLFDRNRQGANRVLAVVLGALGVVAGVITLTYPIGAGIAVVWIVGLYAILYGSLLIAFSFRAQAELN